MNPREVIKKEDALLSYYCAGQLANILARIATKVSWLTPNLYTTISGLLALVTVVLFALGDHFYLGIGAITLLFTLVFDCADGQTARLKGMMSKFGHWYDYHSDKVKDILLLTAAAWGVYSITGEIYVFVFAILGIGFQFLRNITRLNRINFELEQGEEVKNPTLMKEKKNQFLTCVKHSTMFKEADRYTIYIIGAIFNIMGPIVVLYAVLEMFFALSSGYLNYKKFAKFDRDAK